MRTLAIIGAGAMGGAIYSAIRDTRKQLNILVCDTNPEKLERLQVPPANRFLSSDKVFKESVPDVVLLAVKPQSFDNLARNAAFDRDHTLVISIMAGIPLSRLQAATGSSKVVRSMPNLAALAGKSVTGWIAAPEVSSADRQFVRELFRSFGTEVELAREEQIDAVTALSGSGPAYFFYLTELICDKAVEFGFSEEDAVSIAAHTASGAAALLEMGAKHPREWKEAVASKGGTTQAALEHLKKNQLDRVFKDAVQKAKKRAEELAKQ